MNSSVARLGGRMQLKPSAGMTRLRLSLQLPCG
jgi:hypothetical protein